MPVALITGASAGIGAAFSRELAARGWDLVLVARNTEQLQLFAKELIATGSTVETITADLGRQEDLYRLSMRLAQTEHPIEMLVNNAGHGLRSPLAAADLHETEYALQVMLHAPLTLIFAALPRMISSRRGVIINVASVAGYLPMGLYSAIKAWLKLVSESLAGELHGSDVQVTALLPGWVRTEFHKRAKLRVSAIPKWLWLDADKLVKRCLWDVSRGRAISIPSLRFRVISWLLRHLPQTLVRRIARKLSGVPRS